MTHIAGDSSRIFLTELDGVIRVIENDVVLPTPFLDISAQVRVWNANGLLGMAFHPDYLNNGWIFVLYSDLNDASQLSRFTVSAANPNQVDPASEVFLLNVPQPNFGHSGGNLAFGPEGYLWIGMGDGGIQGDPLNHAQDPAFLLGKMLRIDVNQLPYSIPAGNAGVQTPGMRDEIWALGLRSPWRYSFDRETGDLWIADVGRDAIEEVNFVPYSTQFGYPTDMNFGWRVMEGFQCNTPVVNCNPGNLLDLPVYDYAHGFSPTNQWRCAVIGGHVYRGRAMARMHGRYFFADYCSGEVFSMAFDPILQQWTVLEHSAEIGQIGAITGFGEDSDGEIYIISSTGIQRLVPGGLRLDVPKLSAGSSAIASISGAQPGGVVGVVYSRVGLGLTPVAVAGVTLSLSAPTLLGTIAVGGTGQGSIGRLVPSALGGTTLWIQAVENGRTSNVVVDVIF